LRCPQKQGVYRLTHRVGVDTILIESGLQEFFLGEVVVSHMREKLLELVDGHHREWLYFGIVDPFLLKLLIEEAFMNVA
jgi:hypothetical protein